MNKFVKSGIATAAGVALLMGGAGTLAYWNDTASIGGSDTITAGKLNIVGDTLTGTWTDGDDNAIANIANYRIVPGDTVRYSTTMHVEVVGNTLQVQLSIAGGTVTGTGGPAGTSLADWINGDPSNISIVASGAGVSAVTPGVYAVTSAATAIEVEVTIHFPKDPNPGTENDTMTGSVNLSSVVVTLSQV